MLRIFGLLTQPPAGSPEQADTPAPADNGAGPVPATNPDEMVPLAKPAEIVAAVTKKRPPRGPRLFAHSNYVAAVRASDGVVLSHGVASMPADVIELYATGFGPGASTDADGNSPAANPNSGQVSVSIGGLPADVRFAGRVGPGLYQIDVTVPAGLASGDHAVIASLAGMTTKNGALLKIAKAPETSSPNPGIYSCFVQRAMEGVTVRARTDAAVASRS
jgi:uncharacterized protein (TIGR03437 family)